MTQSEALTILKTGANVFLSGEPGSGKTHVVNEFAGWLRAVGIEPALTAATGIAATHINGMTLHSWSGIGINESLSRADVDRIAGKEHVAKRLMRAKVLIIEEVSMLGAAALEMADAVCREARRSDRPFGGLTVVLVGDFFQLPPIVKRGHSVSLGHRVSTLESHFAYASPVWRALNPITCYLTEQYRQDDPDFLAVLSAVRSGRVGADHRAALEARILAPTQVPGVSEAPKLFSHNADVDRINADELARISGTVKRFHMIAKGREALVEGLKRSCLSPEVLELKEGAAVMFTKNSPQGKFVNGTLGVVAGWGEGGLPLIKLKTASANAIGLVRAEPMEWQVEDQGKVRASVSQVPLRLAYAMTVHKSQGMSMDAAIMDLSQAFEYGQGYVALSRVRRLAGVHLLGINERALAVHPDVLQKDRDFRAASEAARDMFADMPDAEIRDLQQTFITALGGVLTGAHAPARRRVQTKKKTAKASARRMR